VASIDLLRNDPHARTFAAHAVVFNEGDAADLAYVVLEGEIALTLLGRHLDTVAAGGIFGEMTLVERTTRALTATAKTDCKVVPIDQRRFLSLVQQAPFFAIEVMATMAERLRRADTHA